MRNKGLLKFFMMFCFLGAVLVSCNNDDDDVAGLDKNADYEFQVAFIGMWNSDNVTGDFPDGASFNDFVTVTHSSKNQLFRLGAKASAGLAEFAKTGNNASLLEELEAKSNLTSVFQVGDLEPEGMVRDTFTQSIRQKYISIVGKINPSPDWFVSIENIDISTIAVGGSKSVFFHVNDAGVKDGDAFNVSGGDTDEVISRVTKGPLTVNGQVPSMGYVVIINNGLASDDS